MRAASLAAYVTQLLFFVYSDVRSTIDLPQVGVLPPKRIPSPMTSSAGASKTGSTCPTWRRALFALVAFLALPACVKEEASASVADYVGGAIALFEGWLRLTEPGPSWNRDTCPHFQEDVYGDVNGIPVVLSGGSVYVGDVSTGCNEPEGRLEIGDDTSVVSDYPQLDTLALREGDVTLIAAAPGLVPLERWPLSSHPSGRVDVNPLGGTDEPVLFDPQLPPGYDAISRASLPSLELRRDARNPIYHRVFVEPFDGDEWRIVLPDDLVLAIGDNEVKVDVTFAGTTRAVDCRGFATCVPPTEIRIPVTFVLVR